MPASAAHRVAREEHTVTGVYDVLLRILGQQVRSLKTMDWCATDSRVPAECVLEAALHGSDDCFTAEPALYDGGPGGGSGGGAFADMLDMLGGEKLLPRKPRKAAAAVAELEEGASSGDDESGDEEEGADSFSLPPSEFRGDRRIVRLLVFRLAADAAIAAFTLDGCGELSEALPKEDDKC